MRLEFARLMTLQRDMYFLMEEVVAPKLYLIFYVLYYYVIKKGILTRYAGHYITIQVCAADDSDA